MESVKNNNYSSMKAAEWRGKIGETLDTLEENSKQHGKSIKQLSDAVLLLPQKFAEFCDGRRQFIEKRINVLEKEETKRGVMQKVRRAVWAFVGGIIGGLIVVIFSVLARKYL